jgi:hypothetical protein
VSLPLSKILPVNSAPSDEFTVGMKFGDNIANVENNSIHIVNNVIILLFLSIEIILDWILNIFRL